MARAILFDLDRTLVDVESHVDYCAALRVLDDADIGSRRDLGPETSWGSCTRELIDTLLSLPNGTARRSAERLVVPFELEGADSAVAMPGLDHLRGELSGRPGAIVTLLSGPATQRVTERFELWPEVVVTRSDDVPAKPAPDPLVLALERLGVGADDAVMVGDSERDAAAARAAGVGFIGITNGRPSHGFEDVLAVVEGLDDLVDLFSGPPEM